MMKYNILWLDDDPIKSLEEIKEEYQQLNFEKVDFVDEFERKIKSNPQKYHAVILDANGMKSNATAKGANKSDFLDLVDMVKKNHIPLYIYSGQLERASDGDATDIVLKGLKRFGLKEGENIFLKSGGPYDLIDRIVDDFEKYDKVLYSYPEVLENVRHYGVDRDCATKLILWMEDKSRPFPEYVAIRRVIIDGILKELKSFFGIGTKSLDPKFITDKCMARWEMSVILYLFSNLLHAEVHNSPADNRYSKEIIANAFIVTMNWYNRFMHKKEDDPDPHVYYTLSKTSGKDNAETGENGQPTQGVVEKDKNGFYHVGDKLLMPHWGEQNLGKKLRVLGSRYFTYKELAYKTEPVNE